MFQTSRIFTFDISSILVPFPQETAIEPNHAFSTSTSLNQQSRRESLLELQKSRRGSNQNFIEPTANVEASGNGFQSSDKYMQDSFETEKHISNRTSPSNQSQTNASNQKGSIRFYDEIPSVDDRDKEKDETASTLQQDSPMYNKNDYKYNQPLHEYEQSQPEPQNLFYDTQLDYTGKPHSVYESGQYDGPQYNDQQNYNNIQYKTEDPLPASEYEYQNAYQGYDPEKQIYQSNNLPLEPLQQEQYETDTYQDGATKPTTAQQHQNYSISSSSNSNMALKKGNENMAVRQSNISKQSATKKFG